LPQELHAHLANAEPDLCEADTHVLNRCTSLLLAPSIPSPIPSSSTADVARCGQCPVVFTGAYRRGNLGRHIRQKHALVRGIKYRCTVAGCDKAFARKDAKLKHARKHHPGLHSEPVRRKQGNQATAASSPRNAGGDSTPRRRSDNIPVRINRRSGSRAAGTRTHMAHATEPVGSRDQTFQRINYINQTVGAAVLAYHPAYSFFQFGQHNDSPNNISHQENRPSPQHLHLPLADWIYGHPSPPAAASGYHSSMGMSTQSSSQDFDTTPSSYFHPIHTESTSVQGIDDPMLRSPPASPNPYHPTSLQSGASSNPTSQNIPPVEETVPEDYSQVIPGSDTSIDLFHIDPVLYQQSLEWSYSLDEELRGQDLGNN
jgi:hypothetical protein